VSLAYRSGPIVRFTSQPPAPEVYNSSFTLGLVTHFTIGRACALIHKVSYLLGNSAKMSALINTTCTAVGSYSGLGGGMGIDEPWEGNSTYPKIDDD